MKTVDVYDIWKECPECGYNKVKYYNDYVKEHYKLKDYTLSPEEQTTTVHTIQCFICKSCNHRWEDN